MLKIKEEKMIESSDWDELIKKEYNRPYSFQQQDGCRSRGIYRITVPGEADDYDNDTVNDEDMGVSFKAWLERDTKIPSERKHSNMDFLDVLWWHRNFYPCVETIANDLHKKGILKKGNYIINIDW